MVDWIKDIIGKWIFEDINLNPPATVTDIENAESALNFKFPLDFKGFYLRVNGFSDWYMLDSGISLWPLDRIIGEYNQSDNPQFIGVCDMMINCYYIGFIRSKPGMYKLYDKFENASPIDTTFAELVKMVDRDDDLIY
jgi:hypothetical protein